MDINFDEIYHFLFETVSGVAVLLCSSLVICIIACAIMEFRTNRILKAKAKISEANLEESESEVEEDD